MTAPAPLFRPQAIEHASGSLFGQIVLARPVSFAFLTSIFCAMALGIGAFLTFASYTSKAAIQGVIVPSKGTLRVVPTQAGVVTERLVQEGSEVRRGDVLFVLTSERSTLATLDSGQAISQLMQTRRASLERDRESRRVQDRQRIEAARKRLDDLSTELKQIDNQITLQRRRIGISEEAVQRTQNLQASNFISKASLQDKIGELLDQQQRLGDLERSRSETKRAASAASDDMRDLPVQALRNDETAARELSALDQELAETGALRQVTVRATGNGTVTAVTAQVGQSVTPSQAMATLLPSASVLEVELYAPSRTVGFIKPGMPVLIRYQAYPFQKFGQHAGVVKEVTKTVLTQDELPAAAGRASLNVSQEPVYRIRVSLAKQAVSVNGVPQGLRPGMALDASIELEKRKLYEWILGPVYSVIEKA